MVFVLQQVHTIWFFFIMSSDLLDEMFLWAAHVWCDKLSSEHCCSNNGNNNNNNNNKKGGYGHETSCLPNTQFSHSLYIKLMKFEYSQRFDDDFLV